MFGKKLVLILFLNAILVMCMPIDLIIAYDMEQDVESSLDELPIDEEEAFVEDSLDVQGELPDNEVENSSYPVLGEEAGFDIDSSYEAVDEDAISRDEQLGDPVTDLAYSGDSVVVEEEDLNVSTETHEYIASPFFVPITVCADSENEDLFEQYVENAFYSYEMDSETNDHDTLMAKEEAAYSSDTLTPLQNAIYERLSNEVCAVAAGNRESTIFEIPVDTLDPSLVKWSKYDLNVSSITTKNALKVVQNQFLNDCKIVLSHLVFNIPCELYWYNRIEKSTKFHGWNFKVNDDYIYMEGSIIIEMPVNSDYSLNMEMYAVDSANGKLVQDALYRALSIVNSYADREDIEKIRGYCDEISELVSYSEDAITGDYGNAYQLVWVFDGDPSTNVVCEGYAKAFKYLCDKSEFNVIEESIMVTGKLNGDYLGHQWNIVRMKSGRNYLVDVNVYDVSEKKLMFMIGTDYKYITEGEITSHLFIIDNQTYRYDYDEVTLSYYGNEELLLSDSSFPSLDLSQAGKTSISFVNPIYDGRSQRPVPLVKYEGLELKRGADYIVTYINNVNVGNATTIIKGIGQYEGTVEGIFQIKPCSLANAAITGIVKKIYNAKEQTQVPEVKLDGKTLKLNTDYYLAYKNNINAGRATIAIKGKGNYTGVVVRYFAIVPKPSWIASLSSPGEKQIKITWGKRPQTSGYQIEISTNKRFSRPKMQKTVYGSAKLTMTVPVQKAKTRYYVRIRSFKKTSYKTYYSTWSATKTVITR